MNAQYEPVATINHKQGNTWLLAARMKDQHGELIIPSQADVKASVRLANDKKICDLIVGKLADGFSFGLPAGVTLPLGSSFMDVLITSNGAIRNSDTIEILTHKVVTKP